MAAQGRQSHLFHAIARRRLEHLSRRPVGRERHHQGVSRAQTRRRAGDRPPHAARPRSGIAPRWRAAHEHLRQAVSRPARALFLGIRAHHPLRGDDAGQMVPREFLGHEQLVARHARPAGHHQPFQTHPARSRWTWTSCIPKACTNATSRWRPTRTRCRGGISSSGSTGCTSSRNGLPNTKSIRSANARLRKCEQWMLERFEHSDGLAAIFPAMLNSLIALQSLGLSRRPPGGRPRHA